MLGGGGGGGGSVTIRQYSIFAWASGGDRCFVCYGPQ